MGDSTANGESPLDERGFAALIAPLGPFEANPTIAVGLSGGADSLCLLLLLDRWLKQRGGRAVALTVDHGLRRAAAAECARIASWLSDRAIEHHVLRRRGAVPRGNVQAALRAARYRLLTEWCREAAVLHLAVAHHLDDQAETVLLRLARGSGVEGLAAMAPVGERCGVRLLRPLLSVPGARLRATLARFGQAWIEDPTNRDPAFARTAARRLLAKPPLGGLDAARLAATAAQLARARAAADEQVAELLARAATVDPAGFCRLDADIIAAAAAEIGLRALSRVLCTIGGAQYPPRLNRLERLHRALCTGGLSGGRTLGGCRIVPRRGAVLVCREPAAAGQVLALGAGERGLWDNRFHVALGEAAGGRMGRRFEVRRLAAAGWRAVKVACPDMGRPPIPAPARLGLPALWDLDGLVSVPHLTYYRDNVRGAGAQFRARFAPRRALAGPVFQGV